MDFLHLETDSILKLVFLNPLEVRQDGGRGVVMAIQSTLLP